MGTGMLTSSARADAPQIKRKLAIRGFILFFMVKTFFRRFAFNIFLVIADKSLLSLIVFIGSMGLVTNLAGLQTADMAHDLLSILFQKDLKLDADAVN